MRYNSITVHVGTQTKLSVCHYDITQTRVVNLRHAERFPWHAAFTGVPFF